MTHPFFSIFSIFLLLGEFIVHIPMVKYGQLDRQMIIFYLKRWMLNEE